LAERKGISRERACALIMAGSVIVDGVKVLKCGALLGEHVQLRVAEHHGFVSRGGQKLQFALDAFGWTPRGLRCLDVGASTGGFTDCLLRNGAASVTALDVGYGQIAWVLRQDPRVTVVERCNFRHARPEAIGCPFEFACADVSFIGLDKLAQQFAACVRVGAHLIALIKPQFEADRKWVKRGVVRDVRGQQEAVLGVIDAFCGCGLLPSRLTYSPLKGPAGNIEFLIGTTRMAAAVSNSACTLDAAGVIRQAHEALDR
jgi:23S rRNA (cytidine1920-2'-O)/16S rRNA (cytidine1409-2'-O)-methyltransferase